MKFKSVFALSVYFIPFAFILFSGTTSIPLLFGCFIVMGFGKTFIGTSVMHDALHGSYSKNKWVNSIMGTSAYILGADPDMWKLQHNVLHHTYTNIEHADEDIAPRFVLRFTPHQPKYWFHRFQHIYAPIFYSLTTIIWITFKDFVKLHDYWKKGLVRSKAAYRVHLAKIIAVKIGYYAVFLGLPLMIIQAPVWMIICMFISMHLVTGLLLTLIFQCAHVVPSSQFIMQEEEAIDQNWSVHQIFTTSNYSMKDPLFLWCFGGLNFQVEHHLFPHICHVHYPEISKIVQQTTAEYNLPYHSQSNFGAALGIHFSLLKTLGKKQDLKKLTPSLA